MKKTRMHSMTARRPGMTACGSSKSSETSGMMHSDRQTVITNLKEELARMEEEQSKLQGRLAEAQGEGAACRERLDQLQKDLKSAKAHLQI